MKVDKKDLEELYEFVHELFSCTDISEHYYYDLQQKFEAIKTETQSCLQS